MKKNWIIAGIGVVVLASLLLILKFRNFSTGNAPLLSGVAKTESFDALLKNAVRLQEAKEWLKAAEAYQKIMTTYGSHPTIEEVQKRLEDLNMRIIFSAIHVPSQTTTYVVNEGDSLTSIARKFGTTVEFIKKENGLASNIIRPGMRLRIWTGKFSILVDKSQNLLTLKSNAEVIKTYRVSTGKNNITPVGTFKIVNKLVNPAWTREGKVIPFGSPENILGTRWLGFDVPGYGLHGTTQPRTIGQQATAGCVRMFNKDAEELCDLLPLGTEITIMD